MSVSSGPSSAPKVAGAHLQLRLQAQGRAQLTRGFVEMPCRRDTTRGVRPTHKMLCVDGRTQVRAMRIISGGRVSSRLIGNKKRQDKI